MEIHNDTENFHPCSSERGMNSVAITIINPQKEIGQMGICPPILLSCILQTDLPGLGVLKTRKSLVLIENSADFFTRGLLISIAIGVIPLSLQFIVLVKFRARGLSGKLSAFLIKGNQRAWIGALANNVEILMTNQRRKKTEVNCY